MPRPVWPSQRENAQTMSMAAFKVMVIDNVAPLLHGLITLLRAGGFAAEHGGSPAAAIDAIR